MNFLKLFLKLYQPSQKHMSICQYVDSLCCIWRERPCRCFTGVVSSFLISPRGRKKSFAQVLCDFSKSTVSFIQDNLFVHPSVSLSTRQSFRSSQKRILIKGNVHSCYGKNFSPLAMKPFVNSQPATIFDKGTAHQVKMI